MKTRNGFVSNSSSSSFCIVGTDNHVVIDFLKEKDGFTEDGAGYGNAGTGKTEELQWFGPDGEPDYVGVDPVILEEMTLPQARKHVQGIFKKIGVPVTLDSIDLFYGEASSE